MILKNYLHVPSLGFNLFSIFYMLSNGARLMKINGLFHITKQMARLRFNKKIQTGSSYLIRVDLVLKAAKLALTSVDDNDMEKEKQKST